MYGGTCFGEKGLSSCGTEIEFYCFVYFPIMIMTLNVIYVNTTLHALSSIYTETEIGVAGLVTVLCSLFC